MINFFYSNNDNFSMGLDFTVNYIIFNFNFTVEHSLSLVNGFNDISSCANVTSNLEAYFKQHFPQLYYFKSMNLVEAVIIDIVNIYLTFAWSFIDLFIIVISIGLTSKLKQINTSILVGDGLVRKSKNFGLE